MHNSINFLTLFTSILILFNQSMLAQLTVILERDSLKVGEQTQIYIFPMDVPIAYEFKHKYECIVQDTSIASIKDFNNGEFAIIGVSPGKTSFIASLGEYSKSTEIVVKENIILNVDSIKQALLYAVSKDNFQQVEKLINQGMDSNIKNDQGWTPLHIAAYNGNIEIGKIIILQGVDIFNVNSEGNTPFGVAYLYGKKEFIDSLASELCTEDEESMPLGVIKQGNKEVQLFYNCKKLKMSKQIVAPGSIIIPK